MKRQLMWFVFGVIVGTTGLGILNAGRQGGIINGWDDQDVARAIYLLEQIESHTRR